MKNTSGFSSKSRGIISLIVLLIFTVPSVAMIFPFRIVPVTAPLDAFSAERAMPHLSVIAQEPHPVGSPAQERVREYLVKQMAERGFEVEVQQSGRLSNVVARLRGSDPSGAIVVLSHYDSVPSSPGAGDNGSGVAALVEMARALTSGSALKNDVIILFDDGEEWPYVFGGSRAFASEHPWMEGVRVAISLDTAVRGPISTSEVGPEENGWLVRVLARVSNGSAWTSFSGGGQYDSTPFKEAGVLALALEANYPFRQQHTEDDTPQLVHPSSVQQMGEQTLAIVRELGNLDLTYPRDEQRTFFPVPFIGLVHYPQAWSLYLAAGASILLLISLYLTLKRRMASWRGLALAFISTLAFVAISWISVKALKPRLPGLFGWQTYQWPEWPEVIPPYGGLIAAGIFLLVFLVVLAVYLLLRRWAARVDFSLAGLIPYCILGLVLGTVEPRTAYAFLWPALLGSLGWIGAAVLSKGTRPWPEDIAAILPAVSLAVLLLPFLPGIVMSDGMNSLEILAAMEASMVMVILPALDGLIVHYKRKVEIAI